LDLFDSEIIPLAPGNLTTAKFKALGSLKYLFLKHINLINNLIVDWIREP
jgi:hypothetical protein